MRVLPYVLLISVAATAHAAPRSYPRVYGSTGRPYGPTQAHYQYERQYGRPWHGQGGIHDHGEPHQHHYNIYMPPGVGYGYGYGGYGYNYPFAAPVGPVYSYGAVPYYYVAPSPFAAPVPLGSDVLDATIDENVQRWEQPLPEELNAKPPVPVVRPSSPEDKIRSVRGQAKGDLALRQQQFTQAYRYYKEAIKAAPDRPEPHIQLGFTLLAIHQFDVAAQHFKRALELDPSWPVSGMRLDDVYGAENQLLQSAVKGYTTEHAREDIRDPDRLFLVGILLHFDDDAARAAKLFETALRLAGEGDHLVAFLRPVEPVVEGEEQAPAPDPLLELLPDNPLPGGAPPAPKAEDEAPAVPMPEDALVPAAPGPALPEEQPGEVDVPLPAP